MRTCTVLIQGRSPYSQSFRHEAPEFSNETKDDYEKRTWRERCNVNPDGFIYVPAMAFKQAIDGAAKMVGGKIPGKGNSTYSKLFTTGVAVFEDLVLDERKETVQSIRINAHANGKRGPGTRVWRYFPIITKWGGSLPVTLLDDTIPEEVFERVMRAAGRAQGVGRFRPENGGTNGRFDCLEFAWAEGV